MSKQLRTRGKRRVFLWKKEPMQSPGREQKKVLPDTVSPRRLRPRRRGEDCDEQSGQTMATPCSIYEVNFSYLAKEHELGVEANLS